MCYPKPGPRCTSHALDVLKRAKRDYDTIANAKTESAYSQARHEFFLTTGGIKHLESKLLDENLSDQERQDLTNKIEMCKQMREQKIEMSKQKTTVARERSLGITLDKDPEKDAGLYIDSIAPLDLFESEIKQRYINVREHPDPEVPYLVLDYSQDAQFEKRWNDATLNARGLILNKETGEIVARPFTKFFNDAEEAQGYNDFPREGKVVVSNKEDGSMGILYFRPDGTPEISTRGSMNSDQAVHASKLYQEKYAGTWSPDDSKTYLFEVIYPENRIVLNYGDKNDLILIGAVDKASGRSVALDEIHEWKGEKAAILPFDSYEDALKTKVPDNIEGYVVHFVDSDKRVKMKGTEYLRLHKIMTGLSKIGVWEMVKDGGVSEQFLRSAPEEFTNNIRKYQDELNEKFNNRLNGIKAQAADVKKRFKLEGRMSDADAQTRKEIAMFVNSHYDKKDSNHIMAQLTGADKRSITNMWLEIRPVGKQIL